MWVRLTACLVWAILALSAVYWSFKLLVRPSGVPAHALLVATDQAARGDPLRLFAAPPQLAAAPVVPCSSTACSKVRSDNVLNGPSLRIQAGIGPCGLSIA